MFGWLERFGEWRLRRLVHRADRMLDDHSVSILAEHPALPPAQERIAERLVEIGSATTSDKRAEVRKLGNRLNEEGGIALMYEVLNRALALNVARSPRGPEMYSVYLDVSKAWSGIGEWRRSS